MVGGGDGGLPAVQGGEGLVKLQVDHPVAPGAVVKVEHLADADVLKLILNFFNQEYVLFIYL